jgi:hypothetical protein
MSREISAHHDAVTMRSPNFGAALILQPFTPALSLPELVAQATLDGPVSRAVDHVGACTECGVLGLCPAGEMVARLVWPSRLRESRDE